MEGQNVNLLFEGMNLDAHPSLQPSNSYRNSLNGNLISKGGNNYAWESLEGTTVNWSMPEHKTNAGKFIPIGWFRIGNRLIVFSTDSESSLGGDGEIGIVTFENNGVGFYSAKYYHADLKFTHRHMIFGYGLEENDNYHRSYWTDNFNQPRTINTASEVLTTEYLSGSLVIGEKYMVLTDSIGSIEHPVLSGDIYGPKQSLGNVFTAASTTFTTFGSVKIIKFLDPAVLDYTPAKSIGSIDFVKYLFGGSIDCGVKMYAYQLATDDGYESSWSYTLNPIHVGPDNPNAGFQNYQGDGGSTNSGKAIQLIIADIPTIFSKIKVAVIEVNDTLDVVTNIEVFWISDVMGTSMTITHYGNEALLPLTIDDISLRKAVVVRCKDMATIKQRQIIVNLTEREELDWEDPDSGVTITETPYEIPADDHRLTVDNLQFSTTINPSAGWSSGSILPGAHYVVRGGTGTITYNAVVYAQGETFIGVNGVKTFIASLAAIVKGCIRIKNYNKFGGGQSYKIIDLEEDFWDYKGMATHCYLRGYWREETYRFAAVAWDKFGNPYAARWIGDKTIASQSHSSGNYKILKEYSSGADYRYNLMAMGLTFDGLDITAIKDNISGISIVRVPRDKTVLAQSLLLQCVDRVLGTDSCPISTCQPANDNWAAAAGNTIGFTWNIIGPETDFGLSAFPIPLVSGDELKPVADYDPDSNGGQFARVGVDQDTYSKYYIHHNFTLPGGTDGVGGYSPKIGLVQTVTSGGTYAYSAGGFPWTFKNHDIATAGTCPDPAGGAAGSLQSKAAAGGLRNLVITDTADFINQDNGGAGTGVNPSDLATARKVLVNYRRPKATASLYGGTSDAAKAKNLYIFTGHYLRIDATVLADIVDGSGNYILNGMEVFGGDCFVNLYDRVSSMYNSDYIGTLLNNGSYSWGLIFPCESNINTGLRELQHMCRDGLYNNTNGILYKDAGTGRGLQDEKYIYRSSYSTENDLIQYDALPLGLRDTGRFPYMARYSQQKVLGETIDNMRIFLLNNFKNADALYGEINNAAVGIDRLFYWQNRGIGYFPVEERETTVGALGQAVQLGVGGVMQRADAMDNFYGNQHQSSLIRGENFFQWFDMRRYSILRMTFSGGVVDVSVVKGLQTFFENVFTIAEPDAFNILNMDEPIMGQGIIGVYDPIKKTAYHTFLFSSIEEYASGDLSRDRNFTIGISTTLGKFVGFFSFAPRIYIEHNSRVYAATKIRQTIDALIPYTIGMQVHKNGDIYVCIKDFLSSDPIDADQQPDYVGSIYWVKVGEEDQIHRLFNGDIGKFFGIVYPSYITPVVNPDLPGKKSFDYAELQGNNVALTDMFCDTEALSASDQNITTTNRNYRYYDDRWNFNYPLKGKQRLTGQWMTVKLQVKNYATDITVSLNQKKVIVYLKTIFRSRR